MKLAHTLELIILTGIITIMGIVPMISGVAKLNHLTQTIVAVLS